MSKYLADDELISEKQMDAALGLLRWTDEGLAHVVGVDRKSIVHLRNTPPVRTKMDPRRKRLLRRIGTALREHVRFLRSGGVEPVKQPRGGINGSS